MTQGDQLRQEFEKWAKEHPAGIWSELYSDEKYLLRDTRIAWAAAEWAYALGQRDGAEKMREKAAMLASFNNTDAERAIRDLKVEDVVKED